MKRIGRRTFVKKAALAGAGVAAGVVGLNEVSPAIWREKKEFAANQSYWTKSQAAEAVAHPWLTRDLEADVAIIGGGFTGLSCAYYIRKNSPTKQVVVLEALGCGNGASGRNGAMVLNMTAERYMHFSSAPAMDRKIYEQTSANMRALEALAAEMKMDCELDLNGSLQVLNTAEDVAECKAYVERARGLGMPVEFWSKEQTQAAVGTTLYEGAFHDPNSGQVHPMKLVRVLRAAAERAGARIFEYTVAESIEEGSVHTVRTASGATVRAKSLVIATNAYSSRLGYFRNGIVPIHNFVGITPVLPDETIEKIGWRRRMPFCDSRTLVYYLGLTRDNRIHIGGGTADYSFNDGIGERADREARFAELQRELGRIFPGLAGIAFETTWSGLVDCSLDFSPSVGRGGRFGNVFHGLGYCGHGVNLTSLFGRIIADLERGEEGAWKDFPFVNRGLLYIPNEPFRSIGVAAAMAYYRAEG
ncbi:MAG: FAD-binding oxidoreductase [Candidatus Acidiferrales bacterium]